MTRSPAAATPVSAPPVPMQQPGPAGSARQKITLLERIAAASASFGDLTKDSKNEYLKSSYLALPGLLKAIKQPLLESGVVIYTQLIVANGAFVVQTTLSDIDGDEELFSSFPIPDATNLHKIGAAVTYGTRYNLLALLAICPDNDDDVSAAVYGASAQSAQLPGLPGGVVSQQQPMMQQPVYHQPMMQQPQQPMMPAPAIAYPVQPLPVLS
jgi:hypothetical protein